MTDEDMIEVKIFEAEEYLVDGGIDELAEGAAIAISSGFGEICMDAHTALAILRLAKSAIDTPNYMN